MKKKRNKRIQIPESPNKIQKNTVQVPKSLLVTIIGFQSAAIVVLAAIVGLGIFYMHKTYKYALGTFYMQQKLNNRYFVDYSPRYDQEESSQEILENSATVEKQFATESNSMLKMVDFAANVVNVPHQTNIYENGKYSYTVKDDRGIKGSVINTLRHWFASKVPLTSSAKQIVAKVVNEKIAQQVAWYKANKLKQKLLQEESNLDLQSRAGFGFEKHKTIVSRL